MDGKDEDSTHWADRTITAGTRKTARRVPIASHYEFATHSMRDREFDDYTVPSYDYFDLFASYVVEEGMLSGLTLRAGVENLADEDPPLVASPVGANTDPLPVRRARTPLLVQFDVPILIATPQAAMDAPGIGSVWHVPSIRPGPEH